MSLARAPSMAAALLLVTAVVAFSPASAADRIVLRNLTIISDRTVAAFDEDGVKLDDGRTFSWDEVEAGAVAAPQQTQFNQLLKDLGEPLYRIRQRLKVGDYPALAGPVAAVYPRYRTRTGRTAYLVAQATMWSRLAAGQREAAVEPYLRCLEYLRAAPQRAEELPGTRRLAFDPQTGLTPELPPIWFDGEAAKKALPEVRAAYAAMAIPRLEGTYAYFATMALAAGDLPSFQTGLAAMRSPEPALFELKAILQAQQEVELGKPGPAVQALAAQRDRLRAAHRPLALYWLGRAQLMAAESPAQNDGLLDLLALPAAYGDTSPDLAAAALYAGYEVLVARGSARESIALRTELLDRYGGTYHGLRLKSETGSKP